MGHARTGHAFMLNQTHTHTHTHNLPFSVYLLLQSCVDPSSSLSLALSVLLVCVSLPRGISGWVLGSVLRDLATLTVVAELGLPAGGGVAVAPAVSGLLLTVWLSDPCFGYRGAGLVRCYAAGGMFIKQQ